MGQRTPTETLFGIIAAFVEQRTWSQAGLAKRLETRPETIRKRLTELRDAGFKLERSEEPPQVYWSVPKDWFPGALPFKEDEVPDLLRLLARAPDSPLRTQVIGVVVKRLANLGHATPGFDPAVVRSPSVRDDDDRWLRIAEDAANQKIPMRMRYFSASRGDESRRHVSVHTIGYAPRPYFIATCHTANALRRFRVSNVSEAWLDRGEPFRPVDPEALQRHMEESFGGFRHEGPAVPCAFFVRDPDSTWVARNLPDDRITQAGASGGARFSIKTSAVNALARFVVSLGEAAIAETPELADAVAAIARGALANTGTAAQSRPTT